MIIPLAEQLRPDSLEEVYGQEHLLGKEGLIAHAIHGKKPLSLLLCGPPGSGKTTIARLYAKAFNLPYFCYSATFHGIADLKKLLLDQKNQPLLHRQPIVFVDEIHRFNKAQQDAFLPFLEDGTLILIGATTENPSFALNNALLSRLRVLTLASLNKEALSSLILRFEKKIHPLNITEEARTNLIEMAQGDGRHLINMLENLEPLPPQEKIDLERLLHLCHKRSALYDKSDDGHYQLISALHKSVRGSDPDASLYWLMRMLKGGEDPQFICRRLIRVASEDVGLADPEALTVTLNALKAYQVLGSPEGELALAQAVIYLALAPKSNALYKAFNLAKSIAEKSSHAAPPKTIVNAPTQLMREMGYGSGYQYDHDTPDGFSGQNYFPEEMERIYFYKPHLRGFEREMEKRICYFKNLRKKKEEL